MAGNDIFLKDVPNKHLMPGAVKKSLTINFLDNKEFHVSSIGRSCNPILIVFKNGDMAIFKNIDLETIRKKIGVRYLKIAWWAPLPCTYKESAVIKKKMALAVPIVDDDLYEFLQQELGQ